MALDSAYRVAAGNGAPVWVTSPEARAFAHMLRAQADAILVGSGTVLVDDPELNCRLPGLAHRSPRRVVVDSRLQTRRAAKIYVHRDGEKPCWVATCASDAQIAGSSFARPDEHLLVDRHDGTRVDLAALLGRLAKSGTTRLMVEGGPAIWAAFLDGRLVDEAIVAVAPHVAGGGTIPVISGELDAHFRARGLHRVDRRAIGPDTLHVFRRTLA